MRTAEEIAERARGKYKAEYITQTNSVAVPIIERLSSGEQLHFVFFHENKGFRIFEPDGEERTPDHTGLIGSHGSRFFLITDERILYIVGGAKEAEDEVQEFNYDQITSTESYESKGVWIIEFTTTDGRRYKFAHNHSKFGADTVPNAAEYINSQIDLTVAEASEEPTQGDPTGTDSGQATSTANSSEIKFCPNCGAEVTADDAFCSECGNSVEQLGSSAGTDESKSTGANASEVEMSSTDRAEDIQKQEDRNGASEPTTQSDTEESDELDIDWTLSFVVGLFMSVSSILLGFYYTFAAGNLASGILFWLAGSAGGNYITGNWNISRWLAVVIFLLLWMTGSFLIGTGAA
jgi:hypothetical protein